MHLRQIHLRKTTVFMIIWEPVTSQYPFLITGQNNSKERTCLTVGSVFARRFNYHFGIPDMFFKHDIERPNADKSQCLNFTRP